MRPIATARAVFEALRVHQWIKNVLIFLPLLLGGKGSDGNVWRLAFFGFLAFGLIASATYIVNDLRDRPFDLQHPNKRTRAIASGALSPTIAVVVAAVTLAVGLCLASLLGRQALFVTLAYLALTLGYTFFLKREAVIDVVAIAALFSLRLAFGTTLADVRWSPWLFVFSMCAFVSLALLKRYVELIGRLSATPETAVSDRPVPGRGYRISDAPIVRAMGLSAAMTAILIMILYLIDEAFPLVVYRHPYRLWGVPIVLFLFFGRVWLAAERRELVDDPLAFALRDPHCLAYALLLAACFLLAVF